MWQAGGMRKALSADLRERIVAAYEAKEGTRQEVARRFKVSEGMVKKLLAQKQRTGDVRPRHRFSGRKAKLLPAYGKALRELVAQTPDLTLAEMKTRLNLACTVPAIHQVLVKLGLTYKKRRSTPPSKTGPISSRRGGGGGAPKAGSIPPAWSSSTKRRPRPI